MIATFGSTVYTHTIKFEQDDGSVCSLQLAVNGHALEGLSVDGLSGGSAELFLPTAFADGAVFEQPGTGYTFVNAMNASGRFINIHFLQPIERQGLLNMALIDADGTVPVACSGVVYTCNAAEAVPAEPPAEPAPAEPAPAEPAPAEPAPAEPVEPTEAFFYVGPWRIAVHWDSSSHDLKSASIEKAF
jgi:hypothetical protein